MAWLSGEGVENTDTVDSADGQGPWRLQHAASWVAPAEANPIPRDGSAAQPGASWQVMLHGGEAGLDALWPAWERMLAGSGGCYYERPEYYRAYLRCLNPQADEALLVAIGQGGDPSLIAPLQRHLLRRGPLALRLLQTPAHAHLSCLGLSVPEGVGPETLGLALHALLRGVDGTAGWDVLRLRNVPQGSTLPGVLENAAPGRVLVWGRRARAWFDCRDEAGLLQRYPGPFRRNLARLRRRAEQSRGLRVDFVREPQDLESAFEIFLRLESAGWKGAGGTESAIASCPNLRLYYRSLMREFAAMGRCQINLLRIGDHYAAGQFCLLDRDRLALLKIGYDEAFKSQGPGVILLDEVLRDCAAREDVSRVDLTTAPEWARRWNPRLEEMLDLWVFRRGPRARVGRAALQLGRALKQKLLARRTAASRQRRLVRRRAAGLA